MIETATVGGVAVTPVAEVRRPGRSPAAAVGAHRVADALDRSAALGGAPLEG